MKRMENTKATQGIQQILIKLNSEELFGLAATVTQGLLRNKLTTREGAVEAILKYSPDYYSILRRKVISKDSLFSYLHENKVSINLPATKNTLIDLICTYWNIKEPPDNQISQSTSQHTLDVSMLALQFSEWFFTMMNQDSPIHPEHFWEDANLKLHLIFSTETVTKTVNENATEISQILFKTKCEHSLYFHPNLSKDGTQGRTDPHGLIVILSCGTLHSNTTCVGIFEQVFMLARDPFSQNNWKIKNTELNLRSKMNVNTPPSLCESKLTSSLLALPKS